jgi:hypothetical protein
MWTFFFDLGLNQYICYSGIYILARIWCHLTEGPTLLGALYTSPIVPVHYLNHSNYNKAINGSTPICYSYNY